MNKKWILGLGMAAMMMGMTPSAYASGHWWVCSLSGERVHDSHKYITYVTDVFYESKWRNKAHHELGMMEHASANYNDFISTASAYCSYFDTKGKAKKSRRWSKNNAKRGDGFEVRYSSYDGDE